MARVVVVGGGFGGLASALRLAKLGHDVTLVEERALGGVLVPVTADGFAWDTVTHTLLPAVVRDLFRKTGRALDQELELAQLDCLREHWFDDGTSLVLSAGRSTQLDAFDSLTPGLGRALGRARRCVRRRLGGRATPLRRGRRGTPTTSGASSARGSTRGSRSASGCAPSPTSGCGWSRRHPFAADGHDLRDVPAWAGLTAYLEQRFGAWAFAGGTVALLDALVRRLETRRVATVLGRVRDIVVREGRAVGVATSAGDLDADVVVCAVDPRRLPALAESVRRTTPAIPAATTYLGVAGERARPPPRAGRPRRPDAGAPDHRSGAGRPPRVDRPDPRAGATRTRWRCSRATGWSRATRWSTRLDRSPRDLVERWGGSPLGVQWQGRGTVRRRLGPRTPIAGVYAAGAHATPGAGLPYAGLSAALVAQVVGPAD